MFRINKLYIKEYKNIVGQTFDFSRSNSYVALIGLNGSGKSNLLEAITLIFNELNQLDAANYVGGYRVEYELDGKSYVASNLNEAGMLIPLIIPDRIPSPIMACYSGEDLRWWHIGYEKYYSAFFKSAIQGGDYMPKVIYVNKYCWKIAFVALLFSENAEVKQFLKDFFDIIREDVKIRFSYNDIENEKFHDASRWLNKIKRLYGDKDIPAKELVNIGLDETQLIDLSPDSRIFYYLYLLAMPKKSDMQEVNKLIEDIHITLKNLDFDGLSEGEKKMILIACLTKVLGRENALLLLDEPDAHVHEGKKEAILELVEHAEGQVVLTTHSPLLCNRIGDSANIQMLSKGTSVNLSKLDLIRQLSENGIQYFDGALLLSSKKILITEGPSDIHYIKHAISEFSKKDARYKRLNQLGMVFAGSASEEKTLYDEVLCNTIDYVEKMVFLFDYDTSGLKGWKLMDSIVTSEPKVVRLFYQLSYVNTYNTSVNEVTSANTVMAEDLFEETCYSGVLAQVKGATSHKQFRNIKYPKRIKSTADAIKDHLQNNYQTYSEVDMQKFKPLLEKLLTIF